MKNNLQKRLIGSNPVVVLDEAKLPKSVQKDVQKDLPSGRSFPPNLLFCKGYHRGSPFYVR
jgi:hypothetical protein